MSVFKLPDLGEGLPDAEIVKWHVKEGDTIESGELMVEMSTAKAVVEVPAPETGKIAKLHGGVGDVINTGDALVTFGEAGSAEEPEKAEKKPEKEIKEEVKPAKPSAEGNDGDGEVFKLPDLGEGLPDAEIVKWHVKVGDTVDPDTVMVEMSTAKAVVEVPAPFKGTVTRLYGDAGDVIDTGAPLAAISKGGAAPEKSPQAQKEEAPEEDEKPSGDSGTVVGAVTVGTEVKSDSGPARDGKVANAAVRAMARKLKVDLSAVDGTGAGGAITMADVEKAAKAGPSEKPRAQPKADGPRGTADSPVGPAARGLMQSLGLNPEDIIPTGPRGTILKQDVIDAAKLVMAAGGSVPAQTSSGAAVTGKSVNLADGRGVKAAPKVRAYARDKGVDVRHVKPTGSVGNITIEDINATLKADFSAVPQAVGPYVRPERPYNVTGEAEKLVGPRRVMAQMMAKANSEVCHTSIFDDADIHSWPKGTDITVRIMRAVVAACYAEPAVNAHFDGESMQKTIQPQVNLGVAVDSPSGLFVPVLKGADSMDGPAMRAELNRHREAIKENKIQPKDMSGGTITLSNFGMIAGKYATPIVSPPEVAIVGIGGLEQRLVMTENGIGNHRIMPVSLTFDHRACTGGEAARFLAAMIADLELVS